MNSIGHPNSCDCSHECREHRVALTREWRRRNPEGKKAQDARYRARHRDEINERSRALYETPERREYLRQWKLDNPESVQASGRAGYRRNRETRLAASRAWAVENAQYVREVQRFHRDERARVVTVRATNGRTPWTEAELRIALDPNLSLAEAALMIGRTVTAVGQKRYKARRAT